jgi:hypothetical protein
MAGQTWVNRFRLSQNVLKLVVTVLFYSKVQRAHVFITLAERILSIVGPKAYLHHYLHLLNY